MNKLLNNVLDKVSENNNDYRVELRNLNKNIDEKTTALIGDIVTISNYTVDFSSSLTNSKEMLVNPISRVIENYVIRDLRSVETVNEQFIDKINDKIETSDVNTNDEKEKFIKNLNSLLNDKYLEIVKIKRIDFVNSDGINQEVENCISDFTSYLRSSFKFNDSKLNDLISTYKTALYKLILKSLENISNLYLNNFVNEVSNALNMDFGYNDMPIDDEASFKPYIPDINPVSTVDIPPVVETPPVPEIPPIPEIPSIPEIPVMDDSLFVNEPIVSEDTSLSIPPIIEDYNIEDTNKEELSVNEPVINMDINQIETDINPVAMEVPPIKPIEIVSEPKTEETKKSYDVEEILKIAKSPIVTMPIKEEKEDNKYVTLSPITNSEEVDKFDSEFDESEIVEEMINRLTKRLDVIKERQAKYDEEKQKLEQDETFVNDLIESSNNKKIELDKFEEELDAKEKEIEEKQKELDKKINDVMPFANAIMKSEEA